MTAYAPTIVFTKFKWKTIDITTSGPYDFGEFIKGIGAFDPQDVDTWNVILMRPDESTSGTKDDLYEIHYTGSPHASGSRGTRLMNRIYHVNITPFDKKPDDPALIPEESWEAGEDLTIISIDDLDPTTYDYIFTFIGPLEDFDQYDTIVIDSVTLPKPIFAFELFQVQVMVKFVKTAMVNVSSFLFVNDFILIDIPVDDTDTKLTFDMTQFNDPEEDAEGNLDTESTKIVMRSNFPQTLPAVYLPQGTTSHEFNLGTYVHNYTWYLESFRKYGIKGASVAERTITIIITYVGL